MFHRIRTPRVSGFESEQEKHSNEHRSSMGSLKHTCIVYIKHVTLQHQQFNTVYINKRERERDNIQMSDIRLKRKKTI